MTIDMNQVRTYMRELLIAVRSVHEKNIIHRWATAKSPHPQSYLTLHSIPRDIKPSNFLYNFSMGKGMLTDFGLAQVNISSQKSVLSAC